MLVALQSSQAEPQQITNAIDDDGRQWAHLVPNGLAQTRDRRGPFLVENPEEIIRFSFDDANVDKLPVDINHAIDLAAPKGEPSPAAGWITQMKAAPDGIWGLIEWTPNAAKAIRSREYRFLSPVLSYTPDKRVVSILRASLTNNPNLTLTALNAVQKDEPVDIEQFLADLRTALGLPADADQAGILAAVKKASTSANSANPALFVPISMFQETLSELHKLRSGISLQAAEHVVDQAVQHGRILPFMRDWAVSLCQANKAAFDDFLDGAGKPVVEFIDSMTTTYKFNHSLLASPNSETAAQSEVNTLLGHSAEHIKKFGGKAD